MSKLGRILRRPNALVGIILILIVLVAAAVGQIWTPHDPVIASMSERLKAPQLRYLLGTDEFGRDVFSRMLVAAGVSVMVSFGTVLMAVSIGTMLGALAGFVGGWFDHLTMLVTDALMAFPGILLALGIMAILEPDPSGVILALGLAYIPNVVRVVRGQVLSIREREYVEASKVIGNGPFYTVLVHVIPNCISPLTVLATSMFGSAILAESALSFLGAGVAPPTPTWGGMLAEGRSHMEAAPWLCIFPGLAITTILLGINLFGDALRDWFDPRMNQL
jgi:peptide/nickel transport system permease protein